MYRGHSTYNALNLFPHTEINNEHEIYLSSFIGDFPWTVDSQYPVMEGKNQVLHLETETKIKGN